MEKRNEQITLTKVKLLFWPKNTCPETYLAQTDLAQNWNVQKQTLPKTYLSQANISHYF